MEKNPSFIPSHSPEETTFPSLVGNLCSFYAHTKFQNQSCLVCPGRELVVHMAWFLLSQIILHFPYLPMKQTSFEDWFKTRFYSWKIGFWVHREKNSEA